MEWADGGSLQNWLNERRLSEESSNAAAAETNTATLKDALGFAIQITRGLHSPHEPPLSMVHQDLKPGRLDLSWLPTVLWPVASARAPLTFFF